MDKNSYLIELSESDRTDFGHVDFAAQSHEQQVFSAIWSLESQVNSGGFSAFFEYEDPELVAFAPAALRAIGAAACADIVSRAVALALHSDSPEVSGQFDSLDSEFYEYPDDLTELLYNYVSANPATFGSVSDGA
jgi:hypothetical protein